MANQRRRGDKAGALVGLGDGCGGAATAHTTGTWRGDPDRSPTPLAVSAPSGPAVTGG